MVIALLRLLARDHIPEIRYSGDYPSIISNLLSQYSTLQQTAESRGITSSGPSE